MKSIFSFLAFVFFGALFAACSEGSVTGGWTACNTSADCPAGQACRAGACAAGGSDGGDLIFCTEDSQCPRAMACKDGVCQHGVGPQSKLIAEPEELDFGAVQLGDSKMIEMLLKNPGEAAVTVSGIAVSNLDDREIGLAPLGDLPAELGAGGELSVAVTYRPLDAGEDRGELVVSGGEDGGRLLSVPVRSRYEGTPALEVVSDLSAQAAQVASLDLGTARAGGGRVAVAYCVNRGSGNAVLSIGPLTVDPAGSAFSASTEPPAAENTVLLSPYKEQLKNFLLVKVSFSPPAAGDFTATLGIASDDRAAPEKAIPLSGKAVSSSLELIPDPVDFGEVSAGAINRKTVTVRNAAAAAVTIQSVSLRSPGGLFRLDTTQTDFSLDAGGSTTFSILFAPDAAGWSFNDVMVRSTDAVAPSISVQTLGRAVLGPSIEFSADLFDFSEIQVGDSENRPLAVSNAGDTGLDVSSIEVSEEGGGAFTVEPASLGPIAPGGAVDLTVSFSPQVLGNHAAKITFRSNDGARAEAEVRLLGIGTDPDARVDPESVSFGDVRIGETGGPREILLSNAGYGGYAVSAIALTPESDAAFEIRDLPLLPARVMVGEGVAAFNVVYRPAEKASHSGVVKIETTDMDRPAITVTLQGRGSDCEPGTWDVDGNPLNGCEYRCTKTNNGFEACDGADNDCDGEIDEDFNFASNPRNCGRCNRSCDYTHAEGSCAGGECSIGDCDEGFGNLDGREDNGCEYGPCFPTAGGQEVCDQLDNDCDGRTDESLERSCETACGQGVETCISGVWAGCTAQQPRQESCNGVDDDCNGMIDENLARPCSSACGQGTETCVLGSWTGCTALQPRQESCNGADDNCNGAIDENLARPCSNACGQGTERCTSGSWSGCNAPAPQPESCNGVDDDCNGATDENLTRSCSSACGQGLETCSWGTWGSCTAPDPGSETCNGADDDCDGAIDEGLQSDGYEWNDGCGAGGLGDIAEGSGPRLYYPTVYPDGDKDWFYFQAKEASDFCIPGTGETYYIDVVIDQMPEDYDLCVYLEDCSGSGGSLCSTEVGNDGITITVNGLCAFNDDLYVYLLVYHYADGYSCLPYRLSIEVYN